MRIRRITMVSTVLLAVALAVGGYWVRRGLHAGPTLHRVELDNGEIVDGLLFPLHENAYVLQTRDRSRIIEATDMRSVDGEPVPTLPASGDVVIAHETFEEILPTGEVEVRSAIRHRNTGTEPVRRLEWGMAPHELAYLDSFRMLDVFGHSMAVQVVGDRPNGGKRVQVDLVRPLLPGEETWYTSRFRYPLAPDHEGEVWTYRHMGDYPESRLVTRSVLLPEGAEIVAIDPEPLYKTMVDGQWLVVWRRFFLRGDEIPWEIQFRP